MFKWKVSRLGGGSKKDRNKQKLNNESVDTASRDNEEIYSKNNNVINKERNKDNTSSPSPKKFGLFGNRQEKVEKENSNNTTMTLSRVGQRLAVPHPANTGLALSSENLLSEIPPPLPLFLDTLPPTPQHMMGDMPPPVPPLKPEWRSTQMQRRHSPEQNENEEALPSDSLYSMHRNNSRAGERVQTYRRPETRLKQPLPPNNNASEMPPQAPNNRKLVHTNSRGPADLPAGAGAGQGPAADLAHWSSHGYLAKADTPETAMEKAGYIVLKRQQLDHRQSPGGGQHTLDHSSQSPVGLHEESRHFTMDQVTRTPGSPNKYFSVKGFQQMVQLHNKPQDQNDKYFSVDASFLAGNPEVRQKIRQSVTAETYKKPEFNNVEQLYSNSEKVINRQNSQRNEQQQQQQHQLPEYYKPPPPIAKKPVLDQNNPPPLPPYQRPPPPKGYQQQQQSANLNGGQIQQQQQQQHQQQQQQLRPEGTSNLAESKNISGSVSWLEWTQQLQAYIAWVNSQLRKRPGLKPVKDLRTDLQSGEVLAQLIEIISGEELYGIQYKPESLQGMRENLDRVLQFMGTKYIKMHNITARELLEGNLKSVMRLILALAAHYKPQSVKHHDTSTDSLPETSIHTNTNQNISSTRESEDNISRYRKRQVDSPKTSVETQTIGMTRPHHTTGPSSLPVLSSNQNSLLPNQSSINNIIKNGMMNSTANTTATTTSTTTTANTSTESSSISPRSPAPGLTRGLTNEGFVRSGSGRKLPQIPERNRSNTLPTRKPSEGDDADDDMNVIDSSIDTNGDTKSGKINNKPKALEFWESMENLERNDFRYNTIHRMSVGRRMLPKPPNAGSENSHSRSQSIDRGDDKSSLNSSFTSGPASLPIHSVPHSPRGLHKKIPPDGASLQSDHSGSDMEQRRDGEGSSDKNSPPTSVVLLGQGDQNLQDKSYEWESRGVYEPGQWGVHDSEKPTSERPVPYSVLLQELNHAKKQLEELYNLGLPTDTDSVSRLKNLLKAKSEAKTESERRLISGDFNEELQVAREAITSLRSMFRESDPGHHILDTLDQCINIIVEKASNITPSGPSTDSTNGDQAANSTTPEDATNQEQQNPPTTKIIYFMPRSATPFMTSIGKPVGQVSLRDFKAVFDRPGFYRYHIKNTDTEYGMVKEEISEDDRVLPGNSGKIVLWVEEE